METALIGTVAEWDKALDSLFESFTARARMFDPLLEFFRLLDLDKFSASLSGAIVGSLRRLTLRSETGVGKVNPRGRYGPRQRCPLEEVN